MAKIDATHPGFENVAAHIAEHEGVPLHAARAILAHAAHHASEAAVQKNPRLKRVRGMAKPTGGKSTASPKRSPHNPEMP